MKRLIAKYRIKYRNSPLRYFIERHQKAALILFFIGGFTFDTLTLARIDRLYDLSVLCIHMISLTITLYLFNMSKDGKWKGTFLERFEDYFPFAIQFFFGALTSAYVVYFSRSVSLSRTASFFVILIFLLFANEFLKERISNKYLQFSVYFFISLTFFSFMIPVFLRDMNNNIFILSGLVSLSITLLLIIIIYKLSPSTRTEIHLGKLLGLIFSIYLIINLFYVLKLIPPVPMALQEGIVAHDVSVVDGNYEVTYEANDNYMFWKDYRSKFVFKPGERVYIFSSVFAPTALEKSIIHRWEWFNPKTDEWQHIEDINYEITGGRDDGFRGYSYKSNIIEGKWKVKVITIEELILGVIKFEIVVDANKEPKHLVKRKF
ncbi:DUF2914 domain-containing protein [Tenacibaculum tangerinum]|uniref:DUF2914 domain-containing protein n=1 Tax=Tenacibaculum tangerinum TaxID=3038772 RepID=A0ABY8L966_9FLAO|nr:DUF2914 domain-containing protein [Tenacibaculum tangerinum]WGH76550.1 DUF2914 domain-containing protein [Tenacibaculum tangerinum]